MINRQYEKEYNKVFEAWQNTETNLVSYENTTSRDLNGANYMEVDSKYSKLLERAENLKDKLNKARQKFFGHDKTE
jgi:hypothetical protein